jgi:hypothetical protein
MKYIEYIKKIIEKISKNNTYLFVALSTILIFLALFFIIFQDKFPRSFLNKKNEVAEQVNDEFIEQAIENVFTRQNVIRGEYRNDIKSATTYVQNTEEVKVAVVINQNQYLVDNQIQNISCGTLTFVTIRVTGPAVLTNTLKAMFMGTIATDFMPGNIIPTHHPDLTLEKVLIENGIAKIYLGGNFGGRKDGWCDSSLAIAQISETAKTFSTVKSVEIYQNNTRIY